MQARFDDEVVVRVNPVFFRPSDVEYLCGSATKAKDVLGWEPEYSFEELVASINSAGVPVDATPNDIAGDGLLLLITLAPGASQTIAVDVAAGTGCR